MLAAQAGPFRFTLFVLGQSPSLYSSLSYIPDLITYNTPTLPHPCSSATYTHAKEGREKHTGNMNSTPLL